MASLGGAGSHWEAKTLVEFEDYYKTLGVARNATSKEIKDAYRRLARKYHPDMNKGEARAEARFKQVNEANEVLSDPEKRRRYDQLGTHWKQYQTSGAAPAGGPFSSHGSSGGPAGFGAEGFSDFFRTFFSGGGGGQRIRGGRSGGSAGRATGRRQRGNGGADP